MYFLNTEMHMITFMITIFEVVMLVFQVIYLLQRPSDIRRLQYLILLLCLITYNVCSGLFTDPDISIPITIQVILSYLVGFTMSMYVVYYFYKVFDLKHLKFFATYGLILFLFLPFFFLFLIPFLLTGDSRLSAKLTVIIPFFYGVGFIYSATRALILKFKAYKIEGKDLDDMLYEHAVVAYISMLCWASLPVIVFFGDFQILEHSVTNAGFLMMTIIYVKSAIKQSRNEYRQLLESKRKLQDLNKTLKKKVKHRTKKLERLVEQRRTTFINLAHETKTPLTLINNYLSDYLKKHGDSDEIQIIKNNINRLTSDMVNFFDVESYEKGFSMYNHDRASDFSKLLEFKIAMFRSAARRKNVTIKSSVLENVFVLAHPGAIDRIVNNIIENAVKYSGNDSEVKVSLARNADHIEFSVRDNGPGIPIDLHEKVFEPYYKLSISGRNFEGMGMGLSIVKKITEDLNGEIVLVSEPGKGTQVTVKLPVFCYERNTLGNENTINEDDVNFAYTQILLEESITDQNKASILIVEDNVDMLNFLIHKLKPKYNIFFSTNGAEALSRLNSISSLDLIISDIMMNDMDGFEFCKAVLDVERYAHIPFIFLTAKATLEDRLKGLACGAIDYIAKPFQIEELNLKIESIIHNLKKQRSAVINHAYNNLLDNHRTQHDSATRKRRPFTENCNRYRLTSREIEVIKFLIKGLPYKIIADRLTISDKTVGKHISNIFLKVGVNNKVELITKLEAHDLSSTDFSAI